MKSILTKMNLKNPGQNGVSTVAPLCTFLRIKNSAKIKRHQFCQGPTKQFFFNFFFWGEIGGLILLFIFIISTELKEIRDFGSILPNRIVERRDFGSILPNGIVERRETKS